MDRLDIKILNCLKENARENTSVISEKIGMSVSAVSERIKKLENAGVIKQYTTVLDNNKLGKDVTAVISISLEHPKFNENFIKKVLDNRHILECNYLAGDYDFMVKVCTTNTFTLQKVLNDIKSIDGVSKTKTMVILSTIKCDYSVELKNIKLK